MKNIILTLLFAIYSILTAESSIKERNINKMEVSFKLSNLINQSSFKTSESINYKKLPHASNIFKEIKIEEIFQVKKQTSKKFKQTRSISN